MLSKKLTLNVLQQSAPPSFTTQPRSLLIRTGQTASLSAAATGLPAPTLQWQTRPANSTGAWTAVSTGTGTTTANFTTVPLALADNGVQFRVLATNAVGTTESAPVTVSVSDVDVAPSINSQPASLSVATGSDAAFAVSARGTEALSYQWRRNGNDIPGANAPLLRLPAVDASKAGSYTVTISNTAGSITSNVATLTVTPGVAAAVAPNIVNQPVSVVVNAGNTATFAVGAAGTGPLRYQWLRNFQPIPGATAAFYSLASAAVGDAGTYSVTVSNDAGQDSSFNVTLTVNASAQPTPVSFSTQPAAQVQPAGGSALFAVAANGSGPLSYQWRKDGQPIAGQTGPVLSIAALNGSDAGVYSVTVSNALGPLTSSDATLTVLGVPAIGTQPQAQTQQAGGTATFSVAATGQSLRYQWLRNGIPVAGGTTAQLTTPALTLADNGSVYSAIVFNGAGVAVSNLAVLTVTANDVPASITQQPASQSGVVGGSVTFTVGTAGTPTPDVVWQTLGLYAPNTWSSNGVTGNSYTLNNLTLAQNGLQVRAIVSNAVAVPGGSQGYTFASDPATLTVTNGASGTALTAVQVEAGFNRSLVVRPDGSLWAFGVNTDPATGGWLNTSASARPVQVQGLPAIKQASIGSEHVSFALAQDGTVWGWGGVTADGQTFAQGQGSGFAYASPVKVLQAEGVPLDRVCQIVATRNSVVMVRSEVTGGTCADNEPRAVWYTGQTLTGQEFNPQALAVRYAPLATNGVGWVVAVSATRTLAGGSPTIMARRNDGSVSGFGFNGAGNLGVGGTGNVLSATPLISWYGAQFLVPLSSSTLALMPDGTVRVAGTNNYGTLGFGALGSGVDPTNIPTLGPSTIIGPVSSLSGGSSNDSAMAIAGGQLYAWGTNPFLFAGTLLVPTAVTSPVTPLTAVSVSGQHALAIGPGGAVYAWGAQSALGCGSYVANVCDDTRVPQLVTVP